MKRKGLLRALVFACVILPVSAQAAHIVFMIGEKEYGTWETLPAYFEKELKPKGHTADMITAPHQGEERNDFPGLEAALKRADLLVLSVRRRAPKKSQMQAVKDYLAAGKPLLAIRTSSHAFDTKGKVPEGHGDWRSFDPDVLGGNYHGHYRDEVATIEVDPVAAKHPVLEGVELKTCTKLYNNQPLKSRAMPLLWATVPGKPKEPIAWNRFYGPKKAKVFYTSLGAVEDFEQPGFVRLLNNAVYLLLLPGK